MTNINHVTVRYVILLNKQCNEEAVFAASSNMFCTIALIN